MTENGIAIRSIQHYLYCPHRWGLMEIGDSWAENYYVTKANLLHKRVHDPERQYVRKNHKIYTGVKIYNDLPEYDIFGVADCIEANADINGTELWGEQGKYSLCIVEYKPAHPKDGEYNFDDLMQVFAQKLCVDYIFGGDCETVIYYADTRKRVHLPCRENHAEYENLLKELLSEMRRCLKAGEIPPIRVKQKCSGCSMRDLCMPKLKVKGNIRAIIQEDLI